MQLHEIDYAAPNLNLPDEDEETESVTGECDDCGSNNFSRIVAGSWERTQYFDTRSMRDDWGEQYEETDHYDPWACNECGARPNDATADLLDANA